MADVEASKKASTEMMGKAMNLLQQGKRNLLCKEVAIAVDQLQEACQIFAETFGETAKECADAYLSYARALVELGRVENGVLGNALQGVPVEEEGELSIDEQFEPVQFKDEEERIELRKTVCDALSEKKDEHADKCDTSAGKTDDHLVNGEMNESGDAKLLANDTENKDKEDETSLCDNPASVDTKNDVAVSGSGDADNMKAEKEQNTDGKIVASCIGDSDRSDVNTDKDKDQTIGESTLDDNPVHVDAGSDTVALGNGDANKMEEKIEDDSADGNIVGSFIGHSDNKINDKAFETKDQATGESKDDTVEVSKDGNMDNSNDKSGVVVDDNAKESIDNVMETEVNEPPTGKDVTQDTLAEDSTKEMVDDGTTEKEQKEDLTVGVPNTGEDSEMTDDLPKNDTCEAVNVDKDVIMEKESESSASETEKSVVPTTSSKTEEKTDEISTSQNQTETKTSTSDAEASTECEPTESDISQKDNTEPDTTDQSTTDEKTGNETEAGTEDIEEEADDGTENDEESMEDEEEEDTAGETVNPDDVSNFELAWEMAELARVIYSKNEDTKQKVKASEACMLLGEISLETEQYDKAIEDMNHCLSIQQECLKSSDRLIAETHYQLGLAYSFNAQHHDGLKHLETAVAVIKTKIEQLKSETTETEKDTKDIDSPAANAVKEIKELEEVLPEIVTKIEDIKEEMKTFDAVKAMAKEAFSSAVDSIPAFQSTDSSDSKTVIRDITSLVRKKRKPAEDEISCDDSEAKKLRSDTSTAVTTNGEHKPESHVKIQPMNGHKGDAENVLNEEVSSSNEIKSKQSRM